MKSKTRRKSKSGLILALILAFSMSLIFLNACTSEGDNQAAVSESRTSPTEVSVKESETTQSEVDRTDPSTASDKTVISGTSSERSEVSSEHTATEPVSQTSAATKVSTTTTEVKESSTSKATIQTTEASTTSGKIVVYLSVNCINAVNANVASAASFAPSGVILAGNVNYASNYAPDGVMLAGKEITVDPGSTVMDVLWNSGLTINASNSFLGAYVSAIQGIQEGKAGGGKGGWIFSINGEFPNLSASKVTVKNGDVVFFHYTVTPNDVPGSRY